MIDMNSPAAIVRFREATSADVPAMAACRLGDPDAGPADPRMGAYLDGQHHPRGALPPRTAYVAIADGTVVGYIAGHQTTRFGHAGEVQYLYVAPRHRRRRIGTSLLRLLATWFQERGIQSVCVNVNVKNPEAVAFYESVGATVARSKYWYSWKDIRTVCVPHIDIGSADSGGA